MTDAPRLTMQDLYDIHTATFSTAITELVRRRNTLREKWNRDFTNPTEDLYVNGELIETAIANLFWASSYDEDTDASEEADEVYYQVFKNIGWDTSKFEPPDSVIDALMDSAAAIIAEIERRLRAGVTEGYRSPFEKE